MGIFYFLIAGYMINHNVTELFVDTTQIDQDFLLSMAIGFELTNGKGVIRMIPQEIIPDTLDWAYTKPSTEDKPE
jgi:hypothetical protein